MKRFLLFVTGAAYCLRAASGAPDSLSKPAALAIFAPRPEYPVEARNQHMTGMCIIVLDVDPKTGHVTAARLLKSTGHSILDNAALRDFARWRFRPGMARHVKIPMNYELRQSP